jgi:4-hydroxy-3-methylbut-2-en-1-yl diphosphate reductase
MKIEARALRRAGGPSELRVTGMGPKAAARARAEIEGLVGPLAVTGFCGAVRPDIKPGEVVVATEVHGPDGVVALPSAQALAQAFHACGMTTHSGPILSLDHVVRGDERTRLAAAGYVAVDMESYWLLADLGGRPACVCRVVLDAPAHGVIRGGARGDWLRAYRTLKLIRPVLETWARSLGPRSVLIAAPRSFCGGVEAAIEITEEALEKFGAPIYVLHEIVHNKHVVNSFRDRGVVFVREIDDVPVGGTVVFSAHGVGQTEREKADSRNLRVVDATCPLVARVHSKAKRFAREGREVVLIGKRGHDEIEGVMGEAPDAMHLVEGLEDIDKLQLNGKSDIAVLTQTTLIPHQVESLVKALKGRFPELIVPSSPDICWASQNRQEAVRKVAPQCDLMLVLGSPNSSNSKRLVEEAKRMGTPAVLLDDETEIDPKWLAGVRTLGLTAGASAPESLIERTIAFLQTLGSVEVFEHVVRQETNSFPSGRGRHSWQSR